MEWWGWLAVGIAGWALGNVLVVGLFYGAAKAERAWRAAQISKRIPVQRAFSPVARPVLRRVK